MKVFDYLIVGSGCSGAMAAQTLVDAGREVAMLDAGNENTLMSPVPQGDFLTLRKTDPEQYRYFLGEDAEGVTQGDIGKGAQITPVRKHMTTYVDTHLSVQSDTFSPVESLGYGGLGIGWGLQCWEYSIPEMRAAGLEPQRMKQAYETISTRIGISGTKDSAAKYTLGSLKTYQPSPTMDRNHQAIYQKYAARKHSFDSKGLFLGRTPLALITKDTDGRKGYAYRDMDFYTDNDQSAWRPWMTINALKPRSNFTYIGGYLVIRFIEKKQHVEVICLQIGTNKTASFRCKTLILATGTLGSARIALRSLEQAGKQLPLLCNPYTYVPCLQPTMVGKAAEPNKLGFAQLSLFLDEQRNNFDVSVSSLYTYQSLMLFRIIKQAPFNLRDARLLLQYVLSGIVIMGVHHPDERSDQKYISLVDDLSSPTQDALKIHYVLEDDKKREFARREKKIIAGVRKTGLYAIKRINPGYGSSIHYAGTLPFSKKDEAFTLRNDGKLHGTQHVYVADSSGFTYLPARGLTFSLLANAHTVAEGILHNAF